MAHLLSGRSGHPCHVRRDRLGHVVGDELGSLLLGGPPDLTDHHHRLRLRIGLEGRQAVDERGAGHGVATDADTGRAADALLLQLVQGLVGERAGPAHDAHGATGQGDVAGGDADIALSGRDDPRAVGAQQPHVGKVPAEAAVEVRLVMGRYALRDRHDELHTTPGSLQHGIVDAGCRDEDARGRSPGLGDCLGHRGVDGNAVHVGPGLPGVGAGHHLRAVVTVQQAVVAALATGQALVYDLRVGVDEDAHGSGLPVLVGTR